MTVDAGARARLLASVGRDRAASPRRDRAPASFAQEQLWFLDQLAPGVPNYNVPFAFTLDGPLDVPALAETIDVIAARHDSLRTSLAKTPDGIVQQVHESAGTSLVVDSSADVFDLVRQPFALSTTPLWRAHLIPRSEQQHVLVFVASHAVVDGWSVGLLIHELSTVYAAGRAGRAADLPDPPMQFTDYALAQRERLAGSRFDDLLEFWRDRLAGVPQLGFPYDHPRPATPSFEGRTETFPVPEDAVTRVGALARTAGVTPFAVTVAAYHALLSAHCGHTDIAVGTPVAGRDRPEYDDLMGSLVNTVVLRAAWSDDPTFTEFVERLAGIAVDAFGHQEMPFGKLVERLSPARDGRFNPLCQTVFSFGSTPFTGLHHELDGGVRLTFRGVSNNTVRFDFELSLDESEQGWTGRLEYAADLFEPASAAALCRDYAELLVRALDNPDARLSTLLAPVQVRSVANADAAPASEVGSGTPETEQALLALWRAALEKDDIGLDDDFFAAGGHSLLAAELVAKIRDELHCDVSLADFFQALTIRQLAAVIDNSDLVGRVERMSDAEVDRLLDELS
jgi:acyl carrier protein